MRHRRYLVLAAAVIAACVPSVASAHGPSQIGQLVPPHAKVDGLTGGDAMGEMWYRGYTLPADENQNLGNGKPCVRLGRTAGILVGATFQPGPCTIDQAPTVLVWGMTNTCDSFDPLNGYYGADRAAQRECAVATLAPYVEAIYFTVDESQPVDLHSRRFAIFSPQREVQVRTDNPFGFPAGPGTFVAWGWVAWLKKLPVGQHTIQTETIWTDGSESNVYSVDVNVVRSTKGHD